MNLESDKQAHPEPVVPKSLKIAAGLLVLLLLVGAGIKLRKHGLKTFEEVRAANGIVPGVAWDAPPAYLAKFGNLRKYGRVDPVQIVDSKEAMLNVLGFAADVQSGSVDCEKAIQLGPTNFTSFADPYPAYIGSNLRGILGMHPHYFYAEALLADYYRSTANHGMERQMWDAAMHDAPGVIVGKAQLTDSTLVRGLSCDVEIKEYATPDTEAKDEATLNYRVVTDKDGCFKLPCDRAFLTMRVVSYSEGGTPSPKINALLQHCDVRPQIGPHQRFAIARKIGVVQPILLRPNIVIQTSAGKLVSDSDHPVTIPGTTCILSWKNYPGAAQYEMGLSFVAYTGKRMSSLSSTNTTGPAFDLAPSTSRVLDFRGFEPAFSSDGYYQLIVTAVDGDGLYLASSDALYFRPIDAMLPIKTLADANHKLPPGCIAISLTQDTHTKTIVATKPISLKLPFAGSNSYQEVQVAPLPPTPADTQAGRDRVQITIMY